MKFGEPLWAAHEEIGQAQAHEQREPREPGDGDEAHGGAIPAEVHEHEDDEQRLDGGDGQVDDDIGAAHRHVGAPARVRDQREQKPTGLALPAFGWELSDEDIADLTPYIRNAWGNQASTVGASPVAQIPKEKRNETREAASQ